MPNKVTLTEFSTVAELKKATPRTLEHFIQGAQSRIAQELGHSVIDTDSWTIKDFGDYCINSGVLEKVEQYVDEDKYSPLHYGSF